MPPTHPLLSFSSADEYNQRQEIEMIKKMNDLLADWPMTIIGGLFLIFSFILPRAGYSSGENLAWVCLFICGIPLLYLAIYRIIHNRGISKISSALLISMAMIAAIYIGDLFAAGEVAFIMEIGALLEDMTTERARKGLRKLLSLSPSEARLLEEGKETMVPIESVAKGDHIRVIPGETIPVDGVIESGTTSIDQSVMTGESLPVDRGVGDSVYSGTMNCYGSVDITVTKVKEDSSLQRLIRMVEEADKNQAPAQRIADRWASYLVPFALLIAILAYIVTGDIVRAVTVMVVFCPCALVLSTPTAIMAAIGQATKHGVIIKSGEALERMGKVDTIAFDKTGTLTYGRLCVSDIIPTVEVKIDELLALAASAEVRSEHPIAKAIRERAENEKIEILPSANFTMVPGKGITVEIEGRTYYLGNEKFIDENGIEIGEKASKAISSLYSEGKASLLIADRNRVIGAIGLADTLRPEAAEAIARLNAMGTRTILLTGDNSKAAEYLASKIGMSEIRSQLLPEDKVDNILSLRREGAVAMVGDGVNDAPALKSADVGIAMGAMGSDIAIEAADVALMSEDLSRLPYLKWLSVETIRTIRRAITISMCINFVAVTLSVLGVLDPTTGALVHNAGSCFVVLLAALLYDRKYK